jgi:hypothetical protein
MGRARLEPEHLESPSVGVVSACRAALGLPQHSRKLSRSCPGGCLSAFELTKGSGAPDPAAKMENQDPALDAGS